jgi:hypothetical protein
MDNTKQDSSKAIRGIIGIVIFLGILWFFFGGGLEHKAASDMQKIENQVAEDAVKQYEIAKRQGDKTQIYVQAGMVAAAYLQAKDEENYKKWKDIETQAGKAAGMP